MKIKLLDDLHMEAIPFQYEYNGEDVLVLAGDIHTRYRHAELLNQVPRNVKILMVAGNHEYYHADFNKVNDFLEGLEYEYDNFIFLDNRAVTIDGIAFFGGTMFTDFRHGNTFNAPALAQRCIADFEIVTIGERPWTVTNHMEQHEIFKVALQEFLDEGERKMVVITHFMPTGKLTPPKYKNNQLNGYFTADMEEYMGWDGLWLCGHGHDANDVMVGGTRVVLNPRGYPHEKNNGFNPNLILEI